MEDKDIHKDHRQRMRERFYNDPQSFSKHELLELVLFYAIPRRNVNPIAHKLLSKYGSLKQVLRADAKDLAEVDGIGPSAATYLNALGKVLDAVIEEKQEEQTIYNFESAKMYLLNVLGSLPTEQFCAIYLTKNNKIITRETYTSNSENSVDVDLIPFARSFANVRPYAVVVAHNHPSGDPKPSSADDTSTEKLAMLFSLSGIRLYDHIIVGKSNVYSYRMDDRLDEIIASANRRFHGL